MALQIYLLRGLVRESRHWGQFPTIVKDYFPGSQVHMLEIKGVGKTHEKTSPGRFEEMVKDMREEFLSIKENALDQDTHVLIAISLGGMIAKTWYDLYPKDFQAFCLMNTSYKGINSLFKRLRPKALLNFLKIVFTPSIEKRELAILKLTSNSQEVIEREYPNWLEIQKSAPVKRKSFFRQIMAALRYKSSLKALKTEHLVLCSLQDRICHSDCSYEIHQLWQGELKVHPTAGHDLSLDAPQWICENLKIFLDKRNLR